MENLEFKGTSGDWKCYRKTDKHKIEQVRVGAEIICHVPIFMNEHSEANAKLIASAPELLEISKKARTALNMLLHPNDMNNIEFELKARLLAKDVVEELNRIIEKSLK